MIISYTRDEIARQYISISRIIRAEVDRIAQELARRLNADATHCSTLVIEFVERPDGEMPADTKYTPRELAERIHEVGGIGHVLRHLRALRAAEMSCVEEIARLDGTNYFEVSDVLADYYEATLGQGHASGFSAWLKETEES
jgi:hypothetical protein